MKYLILSKNVKKGIPGDDSRKLTEYFELGWEVVGSRIDFIADLNMGKIDRDNTTIVCIEDRMFFYEKVGPHSGHRYKT